MSKVIDETGHRYGRLTVLNPQRTSRGLRWLCRCDCGATVLVKGNSLRTGNSTSCGCSRVDAAANRRMHTPDQEVEYQAWRRMIKRCECKGASHFDRYGGRGIKVCKRWRNSFELFLADVGPCPGQGYSLDRIDGDGDYEPGNVRWATMTQQVRNRSNTVRLTAFGETRSLAEWCELRGLKQRTVRARLKRGWTDADALMPVGKRRRSHGDHGR